MAGDLKTYAAPWEGEILLACRKCQKKLKPHDSLRELARLKKTVKGFNKEHPDQRIHVINVPCMDLCPKDGVTVCLPVRQSTELYILRSREDLNRLWLEDRSPSAVLS